MRDSRGDAMPDGLDGSLLSIFDCVVHLLNHGFGLTFHKSPGDIAMVPGLGDSGKHINNDGW